MESNITTIMQKHVISVAMGDTIEMVESTLNSRKLSSVPVIDPARGDCFGIISAPDLVRFHATKRNPKSVQAWEICTFKPVEVDPQMSVNDATALMLKHRIHHLVVTKDKAMKGFISSLDLLEHLLSVANKSPSTGKSAD